MKINSMRLEFTSKSGFSSTSIDEICHVKTLPYLSIVQAIEGNYDIQLTNSEMHNTGKEGFFIAPADVKQTIIHHVDKISKNMVCRWVFLKLKINESYYLEDLYDFPVILPDLHKNALNSIFNRLFDTDNVFDEYICYYEIVKILSLVSQIKAQKLPVNLKDTLLYIKENYKEKITIEGLAKIANLSPSHFFAIFKKTMGVSPIAYLNNYRLSMAVELLLKSENTIAEISDSVGINDSIYFNKMFRKAYQMSPSKYRKIYKAGGSD